VPSGAVAVIVTVYVPGAGAEPDSRPPGGQDHAFRRRHDGRELSRKTDPERGCRHKERRDAKADVALNILAILYYNMKRICSIRR